MSPGAKKENWCHFIDQITLYYLETLDFICIFDMNMSMKIPVAAFLVGVQLCWFPVSLQTAQLFFPLIYTYNSIKETVTNLWVYLRVFWGVEIYFKSLRVWKLLSVIAFSGKEIQFNDNKIQWQTSASAFTVWVKTLHIKMWLIAVLARALAAFLIFP